MGRIDGWFVCFAVLVAAVSASHASAQSAADGFDPEPDGSICSVALQPDGKVLASGGFKVIGGGTRSELARLHPDGTLDDGYFPFVDGRVFSMQVQLDGKLLIAGDFSNVNSLVRNRVARLNDDGGLDLTFDPALVDSSETDVSSSALQPDGKLLIVGEFDTSTDRVQLARLNTDGSLDPTFEEVVFGDTTGDFAAVALQDDGQVLVGGNFASIGAGNIANLARMSAGGVLDETFDLEVDGPVDAIARQADGKILLAGEFDQVQGNPRHHIARLNADGTFDASFDAGAIDGLAVWAVAAEADGEILLSGNFTEVGGSSSNYIARLRPDGTSDFTFFFSGLDAFSECQQVLVPQPDGKVLVGGSFDTIEGRAVAKLARLHPDGTVEIAFDPDADAEVQSVAVQPDGRIFAGGKFTTIGNAKVGNFARIDSDGSLDQSLDFNVGDISGAESFVTAIVSQAGGGIVIAGAFDMAGREPRGNIARFKTENSIDLNFRPDVDGHVNTLIEQTDGKIVIGGTLDEIVGIPRNAIARVDAQGNVDADFNPDVGGIVYTLALQPDGSILVGGDIQRVGVTDRTALARIDSGGHVDIGFNPGIRGTVYALALQPDGKILLGGDFDQVNGALRANLARLNADATIDIGFNPGASGAVKSLMLQADGNIVVGGEFTEIGNHNFQFMARLDSVGHVDIGFNPGVRGQVSGVAAQVDGKTLAGGLFEQVGNDLRDHFARLSASSPAQQSIDVSPTKVTWLRGGPMPELERAWFDLSFDDTNWTPLGTATRIAGGWTLDGIDLPIDQTVWIRARGVAHGGLYGSSTSLLEDVQQTRITNSLFKNGFD